MDGIQYVRLANRFCRHSGPALDALLPVFSSGLPYPSRYARHCSRGGLTDCGGCVLREPGAPAASVPLGGQRRDCGEIVNHGLHIVKRRLQYSQASEAVQRGCSAARMPWEVCPRAARATWVVLLLPVPTGALQVRPSCGPRTRPPRHVHAPGRSARHLPRLPSRPSRFDGRSHPSPRFGSGDAAGAGPSSQPQPRAPRAPPTDILSPHVRLPRDPCPRLARRRGSRS